MPTFTKGHILAPSDNTPTNDTVLINLGTGLIDGVSSTVVKCEFGAWIPSASSFALVVQSADRHLYIYDFTLTLQQTVDMGMGTIGVAPVSSDYVGTYYVAQDGISHARVKTSTIGGVVGGTTFTLAVPTINGMAVNPGATILYYAEDNGGGSRILTWNLVGNVAGPVFNPGIMGSQWGPSAICLPSGSRTGDVLFAAGPPGVSSTQVLRFNPAGVLQQTYTLPSNIGGLDVHLTIDFGNAESFWARTFPTLDENTTVFTQFALTGGVLATNVQHTNPADPTTIATCCPMFAWSACAPPSSKRPGCQGFGGM